ncbi:MAG: nucleotide pyrophosphohydrolase [Clostridia bacterium]|nr:nucleotide pyrophosphohydrolase [Clostridia bacterium]
MDLKVSQMMEYQRCLQAAHPEWGGLPPEHAREQMLWSICELGEAAQLIKKLGERRVKEDPKIHADFVEEVGDAMMYLWDALLCVGVDAEEFSRIYAAKFNRNIHRDWDTEIAERYGEGPKTGE